MKCVDFYLLGDASDQARLAFCAQLIEKQHRLNPIDAIIAPKSTLSSLSDLLWQHSPSSFIPHQHIDSIDTQASLSQLVTAEALQKLCNTPQRLLYLNDATSPVPTVLNAMHIYEVITHEPTSLSASRLRYRVYKKAKFDIRLHTLPMTHA